MKLFVFEIGDGMNERKDLSVEWSVMPSDEELKDVVILVLNPEPAAETLIEEAEVYSDGKTFAEMVINEGPNGECAPNSGAWLVARITEVAL